MANKLLIAKNSVALYVRMLLSLFVSLYTSRVVLEALGVEDFGVYNVVGGIIGFMGFLNASLGGSISRFITYELGKNDFNKLKETFSSAFLVTIFLTIAIVLIAETFGLWFLNYKLIIPNESLVAANWVYQFTILGMVVSVTQTPYTAAVIAHERMGIYAYVELLVVVLRLLTAFCLLIIDDQHLIWYSAMVTTINLLKALIFRIYCIRNFEESRIEFTWKPEIIKPILKFSGWDVFGNFCLTARLQGVTVLINMFFGVAMNAANGIATQVNSNILSFSTNIITAYRPQIIKSYAMRSFNDFSNLISEGAMFSLIALLAMVIPICTEIDFVLLVWLKNPPAMTNILCQIALLANVIGAANHTLTIGIHGTGNVKYLSLFGGAINLLIISGAYLALRLGGEAQWVYIVTVLLNLALLFLYLIILKRNVPEFNEINFLQTMLKVFFVALIAWGGTFLLKIFLVEGVVRFLANTIFSGIILLSMTYFVLLSKHQRSKLQEMVKRKVWKS